MKCIVIDDEPLIRELIEDYIKKIDFLELSESFANPLKAVTLIQNGLIDLIFLDIQMPGLNGLQFAKALKNPPMIIFTTAYKEYALDGYDLNVIDYLLKPIAFDRFLKASTKALEQFNLKLSKKEANDINYLFVYVEYNQVKIDYSDIIYIEGMKDYIKIYLNSISRPVITKMTLKSIEEILPESRFIRIHKSYIVSIGKINFIRRDVVRIQNIELPISETYLPNIRRLTNK